MVQYICLVGFKFQPVDGHVAVYLVLTIDIYGNTYTIVNRCHLLRFIFNGLQERCIFDLRNIRDLNQRVGSLMKRSNRDPAQIRSTGEAVDEHGKNNELRVSRLQDQNRKLTDEVYQKSQMITELEEEKRALIRELFQMNSAKATGSATDTIKSSNSVKLNNFRPPLRVVNGVENKYFPSQNHFYNN